MNELGQQYEALALQFLQQQGLSLVQQNFSCKLGEIDLIMRHGPYWVFVEVKYRASTAFGGALAAITPAKRQKVLKAVQYYQQQHRLSQQPCRIDVVAIEGQAPYQYNWLQNAFS
ncbi:MAG: YraN family protein [Alishewanella sp.]|uniref:YraN family protein n=1 Tax=unclassified Alishewanella TaxID=2628974 RepID=UPI00276324E9|nr:YraN family protein [Alishewanella sp.]MDP5036458.1 YraN family protein [Alishewanella sp.]MDP5187394.1 YraN family protein [Alishewanella sp.]